MLTATAGVLKIGAGTTLTQTNTFFILAISIRPPQPAWLASGFRTIHK